MASPSFQLTPGAQAYQAAASKISENELGSPGWKAQFDKAQALSANLTDTDRLSMRQVGAQSMKDHLQGLATQYGKDGDTDSATRMQGMADKIDPEKGVSLGGMGGLMGLMGQAGSHANSIIHSIGR